MACFKYYLLEKDTNVVDYDPVKSKVNDEGGVNALRCPRQHVMFQHTEANETNRSTQIIHLRESVVSTAPGGQNLAVAHLNVQLPPNAGRKMDVNVVSGLELRPRMTSTSALVSDRNQTSFS